MRIHISPYFFLTKTKLATQVVCRIGKIILATSNLFNSFLTSGSNDAFSYFLLKWLGILFQWNDVLDYLCVVSLEILISPCEDILIFFE